MKRPPILAICIPTYNRAAELAELLESICAELEATPAAGGRLVVAISDNASTDETAMLVERFRRRLATLVYVRHDANMGPDRNFLAAVAAAGPDVDFCWLMGSDDIVEQGGLSRMIALLDAYPDACGMSVARQARSADLKTILPENLLRGFEQVTPLLGADAAFARIAHYFGYLSGQIVRKQVWDQVVSTCPVADFYNAYVHVYVIAQMLHRNPRWIVSPERIVGCRSDNDFFMYDGRYNRIRIDVMGYDRIVRAVFGAGSATHKAVRDAIATRHVRYNVIGARLRGEWTHSLQRKIAGLALRYYWRSPVFWLKTMPYIVVPQSLYRRRAAIMRLVRRLRRNR